MLVSEVIIENGIVDGQIGSIYHCEVVDSNKWPGQNVMFCYKNLPGQLLSENSSIDKITLPELNEVLASKVECVAMSPRTMSSYRNLLLLKKAG